MFRSKKTNIKYVSLNESFKDWKDSQPEIEAMGNRLDSVRGAIAGCKPGTWAHTHWSQVEAVVFRKWSMMIKLQQSGLRQVGPDRGFDIDYSWWEKDDGTGGFNIPALDVFGKIGGGPSLEWSWANAMEQKLQKARQGLA
jgi:hypothetical protein